LDLSYEETLKVYSRRDYRRTIGIEIAIPGLAYTASSPGAVRAAVGIGGREDEVLAWEKEDTWVEYRVNVPESGLYNIELEYYQLPGKRGSIQRELLIDGEYPFREAKSLLLPRIWRDAGRPKKDNRGNDVRPRQVEIPMWRKMSLEDPEGMAGEPLMFYFSEGEHTVRFVSTKEPAAIGSIRIYSPPVIPTYEQVRKGYEKKGYRHVEGIEIRIQAEEAAYKSDPTVRMEYSNDLKVEPFAGLHRLFNVFGSWRWRRGGQFAAWKFRVDESGLYKIGMNVMQRWNSGLPSVRSFMIDGKIPFRELEEVSVPYSRLRQLYTLGGEEGPYLFYLDEGEHTVTMTVKMGAVRSVISTIERTVRRAAELQRKIFLITGVDPDPNREWDELPELIPDLVSGFEEMSRELEEQRQVLLQIAGGGRPPAVNVLAMASEQFKSLSEKPQSVPYRLEEISTTSSSLVSWLLNLKEQPLEIDWIGIVSPSAEFPRVRPNIFERAAASWNGFIASFYKDYTGVGNVYDKEKEKVITVWIVRGREWVEIIKELTDDSFTPETGIRVNVNILPAGQTQAILLNAIAGKAPDVAIGVDPILPVDFGIRGALVNLNGFPDYREVTERFRPGALVPYNFEGEDFALPENQGFSMLFYRTDILEELGLGVPETWDDVYAMLPVLQKNGLDFYYPSVGVLPGQTQRTMGYQHASYLPFLLQRGGSFYNEDNLSALDEPEALAGFTQWTDLYTNWKIPMKANFFNRIRTGEMPIGVSDYYTYVQLHTAAPELKGWWQMAPIPGIRKDDGTVDRTAGGLGQVAMLFKQSKFQEEGWKYIKWWTSTETQARFGEELEALLGVEARWNTSNVEALKMLPWPNRDIEAIMEQWRWFKEQPVVLGGYFTSRHVQNAWNRVVLQGMNPREALELAYEDINRELRRKQEEFGFTPPVLEAPELKIDIEKLLEKR
jgi:ABC-type glycerol-3-phosphate transport system substrate-binding protein